MPVSYLVDTDCVIQHFRKVHRVTTRLNELWPRGLNLSIISLAELWEGVHYSKDPDTSRAELEQFLLLVSVIPVTGEICRRFGALRGELRKGGKLVADFDLLIAATALESDLTLLSNNRRHFQNIPGLRLESLTL